VNGAAFHVPRTLAAVADAEGHKDWLDGLPSILTAIEDAWSLTVGQPFEPGGQTAWVAPAVTASGDQRVVKLAWRHYEADHETDGLRAWNGMGAVRLYDAAEYPQTNVLLLERCLPARALSYEAEERQDVVIADLLRRLWIEPPPGNRFRSLQDMCEHWTQELDEHLKAAPIPLDPALAAEGIAVLRGLSTSAPRNALLCTDLHAGNVLSAEREPWLVIDPKPCIGDPAFDVVQHLLNCGERLQQDPIALVARAAELADVDRARARLWLFARCVQESPGRPDLAGIARRLAPA
jgi:streptomycin 6-kinase